ncbi:MAG: MSCRAMM family protein, partial [Clostridium sp.]
AKIQITGTSVLGKKIDITFTSGTTPTKFTLPAGTYTYKEVDAPVGYQINTTVGHFTIDKQGQIVKADVKDNRILGQMSITKTNENGTEKLQGAQYTVTGPNGFNKIVTTNASGVASLNNLAWGTYTVKETKAPVGYNINPEVQTVTIDANNAAKVQNITQKDTMTTGTLVIEKTDATNQKEVAGAKIQITGTSVLGKKIDISFTSGTTPTKFTLPAGTYTYKEVDAPVGYEINTTVGHFTIDTQGQIVKANVQDSRLLGNITIVKTNESGTKNLQGAQFTVTGPNGFNEVVTTNNNGVASLSNLAWGTYSIKETKAPAGYNLNPEVETVTINAKNVEAMHTITVKDSQIVKANIVNNINSSNNGHGSNNGTGSPKTGDSSQLPIYLLLIAALAGLVGVNIRRKKKIVD